MNDQDKLTSSELDRLFELASGYRDGALEDAKVAELDGILADSPAALEAFAEMGMLVAELSNANRENGDRQSGPIYLSAATTKERSPRTLAVPLAAAALLVALSSTVTYVVMTFARGSENHGAVSVDDDISLDEPRRSTDMDDGSLHQRGLSADHAGFIKRRRVAFAAGAPVFAATGQMEPIHLGARLPFPNQEGGDTLHVWNWSKSPRSRVLKDVRLWEHQRFALSPDGRLIVWSHGDILDLKTGERSRIDLGGAMHFQLRDDRLMRIDQLRRIQDLQFSPDGGRMALLVSNIDVQPSTHPLRTQKLARTEVIQVVEFPTAKLLCEFPAGDTETLRIAFSPDGKRIVSKTLAEQSERQIIERDASTGKILRKYKPYLEKYAYAITVSPAGNLIAVFDGIGAVLIWDATSGELKHRVQSGHTSTVLRFSADGKYLALDSSHHVLVVDVQTGGLAARVPQSNADEIRWSTDGNTLTVVTKHAIGGDTTVPSYIVYPSVHEWEWRTQKRIRSLTMPPPGHED